MIPTQPTMLFIGGGNMTQAMVSGLLESGYVASSLFVIDRHAEKREFFAQRYALKTAAQLTESCLSADVIVLAVKPQSAKMVCDEMRVLLHSKSPLILSVMAGVTLTRLAQWLGESLAMVRAMPNTPALVKAGATGLVANSWVSTQQKQCLEALLQSLGTVAWVEQEAQLDVITALSGSGPAYFFYLMEAMQKAAVELGLPVAIADTFARQTAYGAAKLALASEESVATLRQRVTSKGGTTAAAIAVFDQHQLVQTVDMAMRAAIGRAQQMSAE